MLLLIVYEKKDVTSSREKSPGLLVSSLISHFAGSLGYRYLVQLVGVGNIFANKGSKTSFLVQSAPKAEKRDGASLSDFMYQRLNLLMQMATISLFLPFEGLLRGDKAR